MKNLKDLVLTDTGKVLVEAGFVAPETSLFGNTTGKMEFSSKAKDFVFGLIVGQYEEALLAEAKRIVEEKNKENQSK